MGGREGGGSSRTPYIIYFLSLIQASAGIYFGAMKDDAREAEATKFEAHRAALGLHEGRLNGLEHRERERLIAAEHRRER